MGGKKIGMGLDSKMKFLMLTLVSVFALLTLNALDCLAYETGLTQEQPALSSTDSPNQEHCTEVPMVTLPTFSQAGKGSLEGNERCGMLAGIRKLACAKMLYARLDTPGGRTLTEPVGCGKSATQATRQAG